MLPAEMLSEPAIVPTVYVSGLAYIEPIGDGNFELVCYQRQPSLYGGEDYVVVSRVVAPTSAILEGVKAVMKAMGRRCCGAAREAAGLH